MFGPPSLLAIQVVPTSEDNPQGGHGFYVRAEHTPLPTHASDMLALRTGQLRARGLSPRKTRGLVGRSDRSFLFHVTKRTTRHGSNPPEINDERDDLHLSVSGRAQERIDLADPLDQLRPAPAQGAGVILASSCHHQLANRLPGHAREATEQLPVMEEVRPQL